MQVAAAGLQTLEDGELCRSRLQTLEDGELCRNIPIERRELCFLEFLHDEPDETRFEPRKRSITKICRYLLGVPKRRKKRTG